MIYNSAIFGTRSAYLTIMYHETDLDLTAVDKSGYIIRPYKIARKLKHLENNRANVDFLHCKNGYRIPNENESF